MYKFTKNNRTIQRLSDGVYIPLDEDNADYKTVLQFIASGGVVEPADSASINELRAAKNAEINAARLAANQTTFTHAGKLIQCDELSRGDILAVAIHVARTGQFPAAFPGAWKTLDNAAIPIPNVAAWDAFYASMVAQGTANFNHSQALKAQLYDAATTTKQQIDAIVW